MPQANKRSDTQRPRTAPASHQTASSLDLGPLHQALPRSPLLSQQNSNSSTPRQQRANGQEATRSVSFLQRTTGKRPSTAESTRRAPSSSPKGKGPSTPEGSRIISAPTRWEGPSLAESNKLFSDKEPPRRPGDSQAVAGRGRKGTGDVATNRLTEQDGIPSVSRLPIDLLCQCFVRVESLYYLVNCASVCKAWREALLSDMIWKTMYLKWWQSSEATESLDLQIRGEVPLFPGGTRTPPEGFDSWRSAFMARFQAGKKQLIVKEKAFAVREGYLAIRAEADTYGKRAFDCVQGDGMQKLSEHLCLNFNVCLNRGRRIKIQGKGKIEIFQNSCIVRYPVAQIGNLNLLGLKSVEVTATSDRVLQVCPIVDFYTQLPLTTWEMVSMTSQSTGPLRLLQHCVAPGVTVIVGTLVETIIDTNEIDGKEQLLDLGEGPTSHAARRLRQDELDPQYGLHNWHVSIQFHTFGRNTWTGTFKQVFWNERESIPGEKAVFVLVSHNEVFPGVLKLPWKGEAFSGTLRGVYLVDITLWDGGGEIAWQHTSVARVNPAPVIIVEYGIDFDGEQVYAHIVDNEQGVSVEMKMCIPMNIICQQPGEQRPMTAITNLQVGLTSKFLENWCGVVNI